MKCPRCKKQLRKGAKFCPACGTKIEKKRGIRFTSILLVIVLLLSIVAIGWSGGILFAKHFGSNFKDLFSGKENVEIHNVEEAIAHARDLGDECGYENAMSEMTEKVTTTIDGDSYYRLQQNYQGIPVYGRTLVYATDEKGNIVSVTGNVADVETNIELTPTITAKAVYTQTKQYAEKILNLHSDVSVISPLSDDNLVIYVQSDRGPVLAYQLIVNIGTEVYRIVIDAKTAVIYTANSLVMTDHITVKYSLESDGKMLDLNVCTDNDEFSFYDEVRNIKLYSAHGEELIYYYILTDSNGNICYYFYPSFDKSGRWLTYAGEIISEPSLEEIKNLEFGFQTVEQENGVTSVFSSSKSDLPADAYQMMAYLSITYDLFAEYFERDGYANDSSICLPVVYNCSNGSYAHIPDYHFNSISNIAVLSLTTGSGLDTVAHEFMHVVEQNESKMDYSGESGAIMEALSDIFGELAEFYYYGHCDWLHHGNSRNLIDPSLSTEANKAHPSVYLGADWYDTSGTWDNGGVHNNSTVISHMAYLMWNGGVFENVSKKLTHSDLAALWYRAMLMMPSDCNFVECRTLVELAASTINLTDLQKQGVCEAFDAVGIPRASEEEYSKLVHLVTNGETSIKGTVYEIKTENGIETVVPVPKATMTVYSGSSTKAHKKLNVKNENGFFEIELDAGTYSVAIAADGYVGQTISFELADNEVRYFSVELEPADDKTKNNTDAYSAYLNAAQKTIASGSWSEHLVMTANMAITDGSAKTKTKVTLTSDADVSNYSESDPSQIRMSGSAKMSVMGQTYAWDIEYENGTAHYRYTKPNQTSADMKIDPSFFNFGTMTSDMMTNAKLSGNKITFTVPGEKIAEVGIAAVNQMSGVDDLEYGDVDVIVTISNDGKIDNIIMAFHASLEYQGYDADVDYNIDYRFSDSPNASSQPVSSGVPIVPGIYAQDGSDYNTLTVHETDGQTLEFTAFWYRIADIYHAIAEVNGNAAAFEYIGPDVNWQAAGTLQSPSENTIVLTISDSTHEYINTGEYRYSLIGKIFSDAELKAIGAALNVPADLDTEITQGEPGYWEGGGIYRTPIDIYYNGELIAGASVNSLTGEIAGNIYVYSAPDASRNSVNLASTFGFSKAWDIHDRSGTEHFVTSLAFSDDGTFCCAVGWYLSEWYAAFTGTYQVNGNEIILNYTLDGDTKMSSYHVKWEDQILRQTSEENLVIAHQIGSEYSFEENPWYTAEQLKDQVSTFMRYNG